jgi:hypothetical protein
MTPPAYAALVASSSTVGCRTCHAEPHKPCLSLSGASKGKPLAGGAFHPVRVATGSYSLGWTDGISSRDSEVAAAAGANTRAQLQYTQLQVDFAAYKAAHPDTPAPTAPVDIRPLIAAAKGGAVTLPAGVFEGADFNSPANSPYYAIFAYQVPSFTGAGKTQTVLRVKPGSVTRTAPAQNAGASVVNPYYVLRVDGQKTPDVGEFTLLGSNAVLHNGIVLYTQTSGLPSVKRFHDFLLKGIPGNAGVNPGETFSANLFHQTGTLVEDGEVDGTDEGGKIVAASGIGVNFSTGIIHRRVHVSHTGYGSGWANYYSSDLTFEDCSSEHTAFYGLNFENVAGTVNITRHRFRDNAQGKTGAEKSHIGIATNQGTATYVIVDPDFDGPKLRVRVSGYLGKARTQDPAAIKLVVSGKERPDLLDLVLA